MWRDCNFRVLLGTKLIFSVYLIAIAASVSVLSVWFGLDLQSTQHPISRHLETRHLSRSESPGHHGAYAGVHHKHYPPHWKLNLPSPVIYKNFTRIVQVPTRRVWHSSFFNGSKVFYQDIIELKNISRLVYSASDEGYLLNLPWVLKLKEYVTTASHDRDPQVSMVVADMSFLRLLLNWLIAALVRLSRPLHNVLVLALEANVCDILTPRKLNCLYTDPKSLIEQPKTEMYLFSKRFVGVQIRLLAARLINYWGYSFAGYDTDAIVLRNPQELFDAHRDVEVIGGAAQYWPTWAAQKWGFALCPGAMMIRSNKSTERLWFLINKSWRAWGSEQDQINSAIYRHVKWNTTNVNITSEQFCSKRTGWSGRIRGGVKLLLLPPNLFCRGECCDSPREEYYVSHGGGKPGNFTEKLEVAKRRGVWFLRQDWEEVSNRSTDIGVLWLREISFL